MKQFLKKNIQKLKKIKNSSPTLSVLSVANTGATIANQTDKKFAPEFGFTPSSSSSSSSSSSHVQGIASPNLLQNISGVGSSPSQAPTYVNL